MPNVFLLLRSVALINLGLLIFNMLPIYPLDGGQILRSLLWFVMGRARSLMAATVVGFLGVAGHHRPRAADAIRLVRSSGRVHFDELLEGIAAGAGFAALQSCRATADTSVRPAGHRRLSENSGAARNALKAFDTFQTQAVCPHCSAQFTTTGCLDCGRALSDARVDPYGLANPSRGPLQCSHLLASCQSTHEPPGREGSRYYLTISTQSL